MWGCSLFHALSQWERSKKQAREERDLVNNIGEGAIFLPDPACPTPAFSVLPTDREPGTG